jgi:hypothetical protein
VAYTIVSDYANVAVNGSLSVKKNTCVARNAVASCSV